MAFLLATVGIPLPAYRLKPTGRPYPCMGHACGCRDAEHCWKDCCCYSQQEKLAWAHAHNVTPPSYLLAAVEHDEHEHEDGHEHDVTAAASVVSSLAAKPVHRSCCHRAEPCEATQAAAALPSAMHETATQEPVKQEAVKQKASTQENTSSESTGLAFANWNNFHQCRGLPQLWSVLGASTAPPSVIRFAFDWRVVDWLDTRSITAISCAASPPTPPPLV